MGRCMVAWAMGIAGLSLVPGCAATGSEGMSEARDLGFGNFPHENDPRLVAAGTEFAEVPVHPGLTLSNEALISTSPGEAGPSPDVEGAGLSDDTAATGEGGPGSAQPGDTKAHKRLLTYTAHFELLVSNVTDSIARFLKRVEEAGGYLEKRENSSVTVRVPAAEFKAVTEALRGYGLVVTERMSTEDVTRKHFDLRMRIENAEKARERLLALLEKAQDVQVTLKIEAEIRRLSEEIDRMKGELEYLSEAIAYSTVEALFRSNAPPPLAIRLRKVSRYPWVNELGVEHVLTGF